MVETLKDILNKIINENNSNLVWKTAANVIDNLFILLQFSYSCD